MKVRITRRAARDLDEIWDYTAAQWGVDQARIYLASLREAIDGLAGVKQRTTSRDDLYPGLRQHRAGTHLIFFVPIDEDVTVVRVLHTSRDASAAVRP